MQLIKINDNHYVVVNDEPIKEGDWGYAKLSKQIFQNVNPNLNSPDKVKITHSTQPFYTSEVGTDGFEFDQNSTYPPTNVNPLDLSYIKSLVGEVDIEKIVNKGYSSYELVKSAYISGYNQCLEDNNNRDKTTEILNHLCDKMELITQEMIDKDQFQLGRYRTFKYMFDYIKSLTQPKVTWECEFINGQLKLK